MVIHIKIYLAQGDPGIYINLLRILYKWDIPRQQKKNGNKANSADIALVSLSL